ncbi:aminotransferase class III-fold pyridoxal phosphate-dependent enzyme [Krasilnikovia sp. M28-CT-15]|uniref:aminotransferase class III-fold pyridoxal phosphate-dependent enzyme n=1 Tax=Krasilnikovia sp. M28-CT-15 TaxID=3373540 RepID=UPI00399C9512
MSPTETSDDLERLRKAARTIRTLRSSVAELQGAATRPIAVVGMACRFPGAATIEQFWRLVREGRSAIDDVPAGRWDTPPVDAQGRPWRARGGFLPDLDAFDHTFFNVSPREARQMDPQQRLLLEVSWHALESSGRDPRTLTDTRTGVFVGIAESEYARLAEHRGADTTAMYGLTGNACSVAGGRISYHLGLRGPNISIDTACSSSLSAVHLAVSSLRSGESDLALAGGVNALLLPETFTGFMDGGALAEDGVCKAFDADADGYGRGEGCGMLVLRRLDEALADGEEIFAVIRGTAVEQDGRTNGLTAPSGLAQQSVIRSALANAGAAPDDIAYVETHGTGTALGDPVEADALTAVFGGRSGPLPVGALKATIGHLEAAAGIAGLIKTILVLRNGEVPPATHLRRLNPLIDWESTPVTLPTRLTGLTGDLAGVSSFGFSGTNAHVVVGRAPQRSAPAAPAGGHRVLTLSARTPEALSELAREVVPILAAAQTPEAFADVCAASAAYAGDQARLGLTATSGADASERLGAHLAGRKARVRQRQAKRRPGLAFLFGGQGSQYPGMGRGLYAGNAVFRDTLDACDRWLGEHAGWEVRLVDLLYADEPDPRLSETRYAQPAIYAVECALARVWESWGVRPSVVLGHSTGEFAAAHVAGVLGLEDGLSLVAQRAHLIGAATGGRGATAAVFAPAAEVEAVLTGIADVAVAAWNGPRETLIAGPRDGVAAALAACDERGLQHRTVTVPHAPHSPMVDAVTDEFRAFAGRLTYAAPTVALISNVTGAVVHRIDADYWCRQLREPVRFTDSMRTLAAHGCDVALDVSAAPVLTLLGRQNWTDAPVVWASSLAEHVDDGKQMAAAAVELYTTGVDLDRHGLHGPGRTPVSMPGYPFQRSRHWLEQAPSRPQADAGPEPHPVPEDDPARFVAEQLAEYLETEADLLSPTASFLELGADSLVMARLVQDVNDRYGVRLNVGQLFEGLETVAALAGDLREHGRPPAPQLSAGPGAAAVPAPVAGPDPAAVPAVPAVRSGEDSELHGLIQAQIALMNRQLDMLGGAPAQVSHTTQTAPAAKGRAQPHPRPAVDGVPTVARAAQSELTDRQRRHLDELLDAFTARTAGSLDRARTHRTYRVDTRMRTVRPETRRACYPIVAGSASGAHLTDIDGNDYVDLAMGFGVLLCGHDPGFVTKAVAAQAARGVSVGPVVDGADEVARLFCEITGKERAFFTVSGTDAVRGALRVASAATGRSRFVMFAGSYHGQDDRVLALPDVGGDPLVSVPMAPGISPSAAADALILPYDSERSLSIIEEHAHELGGVLVEAVQSRNPGVRPEAFLRRLREITARAGVPLIFDEVITGFRVKLGGAQEWFGVEADIAAYGKCVGGGYPVGVVAGAARYMDVVDGGAWQDGPGQAVPETTYIGSTFENHPATVAGTLAMLRHLRDQGSALQDRLNAETDHLATTLNTMFRREGAPIRVMHYGSLFRFTWKGNASYAYQPLAMEVFHFHLLLRGIYLWEGRTCFLSTEHSRTDVERIIAAAAEAVQSMRDGGFIDGEVLPRVSPAQEALLARSVAAPQAVDWTVAEDVELSGPVDTAALRRAVAAVVDRHEALRTVFRDGLPVRGEPPRLEPVDLAALSRSYERWWQDRLTEPFDLATGPLTRFFLVDRGDAKHDLVVYAHHVVSDGISMTVLLDELAAAYGGGVPAEPALQYTDHLARLAHRDVAGGRAYWKEQLAGVRPAAAPAGHDDEGARHFGIIDADLTAAVRKAAREFGSTPFQVLLTAHGLMVHHQFREDDVVFGVPVAARDYPRGASVVGYCAEMLPIRSRLDLDGTVQDYHRALRQTMLDGFAHQLPLADIADLLGDAPVFPLRTVFNLDHAVPAPQFTGLSARFRPVPARAALVDLRLDLIESGDHLQLTVDYRTNVHSAGYVADWTDRFIATVRAVVAGPSTSLRHIKEETA